MGTDRAVVGSVLGLICGCISWAICNLVMGHTQPLVINLVIILLNGLMGFTIGVSSLPWPWAVHGLVLGGMFGAALGLVAVGMGDVFLQPFLAGLIYGFLIELILTKLSVGVP